MKRIEYLLSAFGVLLLMGLSVSARADERAATTAAQPPAANQNVSKPRVPFTISKETTYIVQPLDKDGYPDYVEALNRHYGKGVTPENNAAVPFSRTMGPSRLACPTERRAEFFKLLGIDPLPDKGDYFVTHREFATRLFHPTWNVSRQAYEPAEYNSYFDTYAKTLRRPWSKNKFPEIAAWLAANEKPLALFVDASNRPRRFDPLLDGEWPEKPDGLPQVSPYRYISGYALNDVHQFIEPVRILAIRAMLRLGDGKVDDAWNDLMACHRLARLVAEGPTFDEFMNVLFLEGAISVAEQGMLRHTRLSASQIKRMMADLNRLPSMPDLAERVDIGMRCEYLNMVRWMSQDYLASLVDRLEYRPEKKAWMRTLAQKLNDGIEWDVLFRKGNAAIDRVVDSMHNSTHAQREALEHEIRLRYVKDGTTPGQDMAQLRKNLEHASTDAEVRSVLQEAAENRKATLERLANFLCYDVLESYLTRSDIQDRIRMQFELTKLAFALAAYRADHGEFPAKLADLAPKYIESIPKDAFIDADLHYRVQDAGYLLYSVGPNRQDDGGKGVGDWPEGRTESWDDISVRMASPK